MALLPCIMICCPIKYLFKKRIHPVFQVQDLKQSLEHQRKELNDCRAEVTALKMHIEGSRSGRNMVAVDVDHVQSLSLERYKEEVKSLQIELENLKSKIATAPDFVDSTQSGKESMQIEEKVVVMDEEKSIIQHPVDAVTRVKEKETDQSLAADDNIIKAKEVSEECSVSPSNDSSALTNGGSVSKENVEPSSSNTLHLTTEDLNAETVSEKRASSVYLFYFYASKPVQQNWIGIFFLLPGLAGGTYGVGSFPVNPGASLFLLFLDGPHLSIFS